MAGFFSRFIRINNSVLETVTSALDGQRFFIGRNGDISTDAETALDIVNDDVRVFNRGDITSENAETTINVSGEDARIMNFRGATISADGGEEVNGVAIDITGSADIRNFGTIEADFTAVDFSGAEAGGSLINARSGDITSDSRAVNIDGDDVSFRNFGDVIGTGDQRNGTVYANDTAEDYLIVNSRRATIDAGEGNQGAAISLSLSTEDDVDARVFNFGDVAGRGNASAGSALAGDGIRLETVREGGALGANEGTFTGTIFNNGSVTSEGANGTVGGFRAVNGVNFQGTLTNERSGEISGVQNGVYFGTGDHDGGVFNNRGVVSSDSRDLNIDGTGLEVNNTRNGQIIGTGDQRNGTVYADGTADDFTFNNIDNALVDAGEGNQGSGFGAEIGQAADGANTFELNNEGTIAGRGNAAAGTNAAGDGVRIGNPGNSGVTDATITNIGTITSEGANGTVAGLRVVDGVDFQGTLNNGAGGVISGVQNGVYFGNGNHTGGAFNNEGLVTSDSRALNIDGTGLEVNNSGTFLGTGNQRNGTVYADGTADDFSFDNEESGIIDAGEGNEGSGFGAEIGSAADGANTFDLTNEGTIQGRGNGAAGTNAAGDGVRIGNVGNIGVFDGEIDNSGTIDSEGANGTVAGIRFVNGISFQGELNNQEDGVISGVQNGLYFGNPVNGEGADHTGGVVNNAGLISSDSRALNIDGLGLEVNNLDTGRIIGTGNQRNGTVYADGGADDFSFDNAGLVDAGEGNTGSGFGAEIGGTVDGANTFELVNSGTIQGRGQASAADNAAGDGVRIGNVGNIGVFDGEITNSGTIDSESTQGTTAGIRFVNGISFQGELNNEQGGIISGAQNGLYFGNPVDGQGADHTGGVVNNAGVISSDSRALNIDGLGLEVNNLDSGEIIGTGNQRNGTVYADGGADNFSFDNAGLVDAGEGNTGSGFGAEIGQAVDGANTFELDNSGTIAGRGNAAAGTNAAGDGIRIGNVGNVGTTDATITNSGSITSEGANGTVGGVRVVNNINFQGSLANEDGGEISGVQNGVYFGTGDHTGGLFLNEGTVTSDSRAVNIDGEGLVTVNTGEILATGDQRNGTVYADATADNYVFVNTEDGTVDGDGFNASAVSLQVGDAVSAVVANDGLLQGSGDSEAANQIGHGLRFFAGAEAPTFEGVALNTGEINGSGDSDLAAGVSIEGVELSGVFANFGDITGNVNAIDASGANGVNIVNGGDIDGNVILSAVDDTFVFIEGGDIDGLVDAGDGEDTLVLVGFDEDEVQDLIDSGDFVGFETILSGDDALDFSGTLAALDNDDASLEEVILALASDADAFAEVGGVEGALAASVDTLFNDLDDTPAGDLLALI